MHSGTWMDVIINTHTNYVCMRLTCEGGFSRGIVIRDDMLAQYRYAYPQEAVTCAILALARFEETLRMLRNSRITQLAQLPAEIREGSGQGENQHSGFACPCPGSEKELTGEETVCSQLLRRAGTDKDEVIDSVGLRRVQPRIGVVNLDTPVGQLLLD